MGLEIETHRIEAVLLVLTKYLTISLYLRARDFYEVIVDESEARINYHLIEIESEYNPIVSVESEIKHKILHENIEKRELEAIFLKNAPGK